MATKINVYNQQGEKVDQMELADHMFNVAPKLELIQQARVTQMANERQVVAHTKGRSEVRGGGRKPWRQKGTGNARHGSIRSPIWIGGGITFGPSKFKQFSKKINKKMKRKAIFMVLSDKVANSALLVLDKVELPEFKTKKVKEIINNLENNLLGRDFGKESNRKSLLIINDQKDEKVKYSVRNLPGVKVIHVDNINILDLLKYKYLVTTSNAIKTIEERFNK